MQRLLEKVNIMRRLLEKQSVTILQQATEALDDDISFAQNPFQVTESDDEDAYEDFQLIEANSDGDEAIDIEL